MFNLFRKKAASQQPPPLPSEQPKSDDPFIAKVQESGEFVESTIEGLYGMFRMGVMSPPEFFSAIIKQNVFIICSERDNPNSALFLQHPDGASRLAFFSTTEKAKKLFETHTQFSHVFELPLRDILIGIPPTSGFVMNPTFEAMTMQATPEQVQHIKNDFLSA